MGKMKPFLSIIFILMSLGCGNVANRKSIGTETKAGCIEDNSLSAAMHEKLGISEDLLLPVDSLGMDSIKTAYQDFCLNNSSDEENEDNLYINERYVNIIIPYAFSDLLKNGFVPVSAGQYEKKLGTLKVGCLQRKDIPYIYEYKHYFSSPTILQGWQDDIAEDGIDRQEEAYVRYAPISNIFVKGYNFVLPEPVSGSVLKRDKGRIVFGLSDEAIHLNKFLFNDNKASLVWLSQHSPETIIDLLMSYGYDRNETINKLVLNDILKSNTKADDISELLNTFVRKVYSRKPHLEIREGLLKTMLTLPVDDKNMKWETILDSFVSSLLQKESENSPYWLVSFSQDERLTIAAYMGYYLYKERLRNSSVGSTGFASEIYYNNRLRNYIKRHQYFKLTGFKEICDSIYREYDSDMKIHQEAVHRNQQ